MKNQRFFPIVFTVFVVAVCAWILLNPLLEREAVHTSDVVANSASLPAGVEAKPPEAVGAGFLQWASQGEAMGVLPASLIGTRVDGELTLDSQGHLVIDLGLRRVFDYFLATMGEENLQQIRARIAFYLQQHLPLEAALAAWAVLDQYLGYKEALEELPGHDGSYEGMRASLQQQREMRDALLGPELAEAFFHDEDVYADFALEHIGNLRNPDLSAEDKQHLTEALLASLPDETRAMIEATGAPLSVEQKVESMREQGAGAADIWQFREQQFGSAAAERLARLDQKREQWQQRYDAYTRQRDAISNSSLASVDRQNEIARLREQQFSAVEIRRVEALDRLATQADLSARAAQ